MKEITGFKTIEEIFSDAEHIGDITTPEGKERIITFFYKAVALHSSEYSKNNLPEIFGNVIIAAFKRFTQTTPIPPKEYYFENNKLKEGKDLGDSIIGNSLLNLSATLFFHSSKIIEYNQEKYNQVVTKYTQEEIMALAQACENYLNQSK